MNALLDKAFKMDVKPTQVASQTFQIFDSYDYKDPIPTQTESNATKGLPRGKCKFTARTVKKTNKKQSHKTLGGSMTITWLHGLCLGEH